MNKLLELYKKQNYFIKMLYILFHCILTYIICMICVQFDDMLYFIRYSIALHVYGFTLYISGYNIAKMLINFKNPKYGLH